MVKRCEARQDRTGAFECLRCGYQWDRDDTAPDCKTDQQLNVEHGRETLDKLKGILKDDGQ